MMHLVRLQVMYSGIWNTMVRASQGPWHIYLQLSEEVCEAPDILGAEGRGNALTHHLPVVVCVRGEDVGLSLSM